ncbi:cell wall hydrolase [Priestia megaterium]|nr:cell wall hydrolase [Priestia megaterium]
MLVVFFVVLSVVIFYTHPTAEAASLQLANNEQGEGVILLQKQLVKMGYLHTNPTGQYGPLTTEAVRQFQGDTGLVEDGIAGPSTYRQVDNVKIMAHAVYGEARGELYAGQVAVAAVILNRAESPEFPHAISDIIFQKNAFTAVEDGQYFLTPDRIAYRAVIDAYKGWDPTDGAVYYYNPDTATNEWIFTRDAYKRIGSHVFAR